MGYLKSKYPKFVKKVEVFEKIQIETNSEEERQKALKWLGPEWNIIHCGPVQKMLPSNKYVIIAEREIE